MNEDFRLYARRGLMIAMKHAPGIVGQIPAGSIYGGTVPATRTLPFSRVGSVIGTPFRASGLDSGAYRIMLQGFTQGVKAAGEVLAVTAEDHADHIAGAFKAELDGATITLENGLKLRLSWVQTITAIDGDDSDAWMTTGIFVGEVAG